MADVWVDENGNEYTSDELEFEAPEVEETGESANRLYARRLLDLATDWNPVGSISKPIAAYAISKVTGEPYEDVRTKMDEGSERAKEYVEQDSPKASSVLGAAVPLTGQIAGTVAGLGALGAGAKAALPTIARTAAKVPGATTAARAVADVGSKVAKAPVIRTALSTKPLSSSTTAAGLVGAGTAAVDAIKGETAADTIIDTVGNMADTFAYMYGVRTLPFKSVPAAMAAYEVLTNPIGRASRGESPVSLEDFTKDVTQGVAGGALARYARPAETSTAKGSKLAKQADLYKKVTNQTTGDIDEKAKALYKRQRALRDIPLEANVATQASLKPALPKEVRATAKHHGDMADKVGEKLKASLNKYSKGTTTEELLAMRVKGEKQLAKYKTKLLEKQPYVTAEKVEKTFKDPEELEAFLTQYAKIRSEDSQPFVIPSLEDAPKFKTEYLLKMRPTASKASTKDGTPITRKLAGKIYDLFDDKSIVKQLEKANRTYSTAMSLREASSKALAEGRGLSSTSVMKQVSSEPGSNRELVSKLLRSIEDKTNTGSVANGVFTPKTLPKRVQDLLTEYDYHRSMEAIANSEMVRKGSRGAISELSQRALAAPVLGSNFAAYTGLKEAYGALGRHLPKVRDRAVLDFMSNVPADLAIEALKAKSGNAIKESMMNNIISELIKGGAK